MSDPAAIPPTAPSFVESILMGVTRHVLTIVAGALVADGLLSGDQSSQFVQIGAGILVAASGLLWSVIQKRLANRHLIAALNTPVPVPAPSSPSVPLFAPPVSVAPPPPEPAPAEPVA